MEQKTAKDMKIALRCQAQLHGADLDQVGKD